MQYCKEHWGNLRTAIEDVGLGDLVAKDSETAFAQFVDTIEKEETTPVNFDPLMWAHWAIIDRIAKHEPYVVIQPGCPLCWVKEGHRENCKDPNCNITDETFEAWIPGVAEFLRDNWKEVAGVKDEAS